MDEHKEYVPAGQNTIEKNIKRRSSKYESNSGQGRGASNRSYPVRNCQKAECNEEFIPSDSRHIYCCDQHRIDHNNDKRKIVDKIENDFTRKAKKNRSILIKIISSKEYIRRGYIHISVLDYEGYDFSIYHKIMLESSTKRELKLCYEYGILLIDSENKNYQIYKYEDK